MIRTIKPKASNRHRFILVAIDYFTKWVEAASYASVTRNVVIRFIKEIICEYGLPRKIITDNATNLNNKIMKEMCEDFKIQHHNSTPYRPKMNGAVEAANKNIKKIVQKISYHTRIGTRCFPLHCMVIKLLCTHLLGQPRYLWNHNHACICILSSKYFATGEMNEGSLWVMVSTTSTCKPKSKWKGDTSIS